MNIDEDGSLTSDDDDDEDDVDTYDPIGAFVLCAEANKWLFTPENSESRIAISVAHNDKTYQIDVKYDEDDGLLTVSALIELDEQPTDELAFLKLINSSKPKKIEVGSLYYVEEFGLLVWSVEQTLIGIESLTTKQAAALLWYAVEAIQTAKTIFGIVEKKRNSSDLPYMTLTSQVRGSA